MRPPHPDRNAERPLLVCHSHLRWDWVYQRPQHVLSRLARQWPVLVEEEPVFDDRPPGLDVLAGGRGRDRLAAAPAGRPGFRPRAAGRGLYRAWSAAGGRWSAGSTRRCSPPTATGSGRVRSSFTTAWTNWRTSPARRPDWPRPRPGCSNGPTSSSPAGGAFTSRSGTGTRTSTASPRPSSPSTSRRALDPALALPADVAGLPRPIFGYYGAVDERLDYDLIAALADAPGVGSVVLVGPMIKVDPAVVADAGRTCITSGRRRMPTCPPTSRRSTSA